MDFRKHKEEDVTGKVRRARTWDVRMSTLPTSYARQARAARSLGDIGVPSRRPGQVMVGHGLGTGREQGLGHGLGTGRGPGLGREQGVGHGLGAGREQGLGRGPGLGREQDASRGSDVVRSPGVRLDTVA